MIILSLFAVGGVAFVVGYLLRDAQDLWMVVRTTNRSVSDDPPPGAEVPRVQYCRTCGGSVDSGYDSMECLCGQTHHRCLVCGTLAANCGMLDD